jgi:flagellin
LDVGAAVTTGVYDVAFTLTNTSSGATFTENVKLNVTAAAGGSVAAASGAGTDLTTQALTSFVTGTTGGTSGGEAVSVSLTTLADDATALADLDAFEDAHSGGTFAITASSQADGANNDFSIDSSNNLVLKKGLAAGTYTATVTYTSGSNVFTQKISVTTADATEAGAATATQTSTNDTAAATRTSTEVTSGKSSLLVNEARQGSVKSVGTGRVLSEAFNDFVTAHSGGTYTLEGTDAAAFKVDAKTGDVTSTNLIDYETKTSYEFTVKYTEGTNVYSEAITMTVTDDTADAGTHLADVDLSTQSGAASSVLILDKALAQISSSQAKLGAIQNRLQHNIDNLSMASMLTETARGRVVDADFARETSELSKQQILGQAATSMLAQANQSKQSVLALLQ